MKISNIRYIILEIYSRPRLASCARVARALRLLGCMNRFGKPITRQGVLYHMQKTEEGRAMLKASAARHEVYGKGWYDGNQLEVHNQVDKFLADGQGQ